MSSWQEHHQSIAILHSTQDASFYSLEMVLLSPLIATEFGPLLKQAIIFSKYESSKGHCFLNEGSWNGRQNQLRFLWCKHNAGLYNHKSESGRGGNSPFSILSLCYSRPCACLDSLRAMQGYVRQTKTQGQDPALGEIALFPLQFVLPDNKDCGLAQYIIISRDTSYKGLIGGDLKRQCSKNRKKLSCHLFSIWGEEGKYLRMEA